MKRSASLVLVSLLSIASLFSEAKYDYASLYSSMLSNNTKLKSAQQDIYNAKLDVKDAEAAYYPSIDLTLMGVYMANPPIGPLTISTDELVSSLGLAPSVGQVGSNYITLYDGMENALYSASISLTQPLITWGKIPLSVKLFKTAADIQSDKKTDLERQLEAELNVRLGSLYYIGNIFGLLGEAKDRAERLLALSESARDNGLLLDEDVLEAEISKMELDVRESELISQENSLLLGLRTLTGINSLKKDEIDYTQNEAVLEKYKDSDLAELEEKAVSPSNTNLNMINKLKSVHKLQEDIAWREIYGAPDFALQVSAGYGGSRFPFIETGWMQHDDWSVNVSVVMNSNLWDGGKTLNNIDRAKSSQISDDIQYEDAKNQIISNLEENWNSMVLSLKRLEYLNLKADSLDKSYELMKKQYDSGRLSESDLLQKELEIISNDIEIATLKITLVQNVYLIDYLVSNQGRVGVQDGKAQS